MGAFWPIKGQNKDTETEKPVSLFISTDIACFTIQNRLFMYNNFITRIFSK